MRKAARGHVHGFVVTHVGQGLAFDIDFMLRSSKDKSRVKRLDGISSRN
jgi:predicted Co/Zn/Cd cation transporter (cation efflux family)